MPKKETLWEGFYLLVLIAELRDKMEPTGDGGGERIVKLILIF